MHAEVHAALLHFVNLFRCEEWSGLFAIAVPDTPAADMVADEHDGGGHAVLLEDRIGVCVRIQVAIVERNCDWLRPRRLLANRSGHVSPRDRLIAVLMQIRD